MTTLNRLVIDWSGPAIVGRAVTVLHFDGSDNAAPPVAAVKAAFEAAKVFIPVGNTLTFPTSGDQITDTTGALSGVWTATGGGTVTGTGDTLCAAGVGACIGWTTGGIVTGTKGPRKVRGRTFLVPITGAFFDAQGTLSAACLTTLNTLAASLMASGPLAVWHRPTTAGGTDGNSYGVQSYKVRDKVAYLSSRRD